MQTVTQTLEHTFKNVFSTIRLLKLFVSHGNSCRCGQWWMKDAPDAREDAHKVEQDMALKLCYNPKIEI
jgi:hypothetical protein